MIDSQDVPLKSLYWDCDLSKIVDLSLVAPTGNTKTTGKLHIALYNLLAM